MHQPSRAANAQIATPTPRITHGVCQWSFLVLDPNSKTHEQRLFVRCNNCKGVFIACLRGTNPCSICGGLESHEVVVSQRLKLEEPSRNAALDIHSDVSSLHEIPVGLSRKKIIVGSQKMGIVVRNNSEKRFWLRMKSLPFWMSCDWDSTKSKKSLDPGDEVEVAFWGHYVRPGVEPDPIELYRIFSSPILIPTSESSSAIKEAICARITCIPMPTSWLVSISGGTTMVALAFAYVSLMFAFSQVTSVALCVVSIGLWMSLSVFLYWNCFPGYLRNYLRKQVLLRTHKETKNAFKSALEFHQYFEEQRFGWALRITLFPILWISLSVIAGLFVLLVRLTGLHEFWVTKIAATIAFVVASAYGLRQCYPDLLAKFTEPKSQTIVTEVENNDGK
jgi:hypothetical protein